MLWLLLNLKLARSFELRTIPLMTSGVGKFILKSLLDTPSSTASSRSSVADLPPQLYPVFVRLRETAKLAGLPIQTIYRDRLQGWAEQSTSTIEIQTILNFLASCGKLLEEDGVECSISGENPISITLTFPD